MRRIGAQFQAGQVDITKIFDARAALAAGRQNQLDALHELALSAADLTEAVAFPPEALFLRETPAPAPAPKGE